MRALFPLLRFRMATGLRRASMIWSGALIAILVAGGLQSPPPFGAWAASWAALDGTATLLALLVIAVALRSVTAAVLNPLLHGESNAHLRLLPLDRATRYALEWLTAATFLAVPLLALATLWIVGEAELHRSSVRAAALSLVSALAIITAATLRSSREHPRLQVRANAALSEPPPRVLAPALRLVVEELRWTVRTAPSLFSSTVIALLILLAAPLAARNNGVASTLPLMRIWTLAAAVATGVSVFPVVRARSEALRYRAIDELLPQSNASRMLVAAAAAWSVTLPLIVTAPIASGAVVGTVVALEVLVFAVMLRLLGEAEARGAQSRVAFFNLSVTAAALSFGLHPLLGFGTLGALTAGAAAAARTSLRRDFPRVAAEELA